MTPERRLADNIKRLQPVNLWMTQGEVVAVDGLTCTVRIGDADIEGVRLRASLTERERQVLVVPKIGSSVTLGCLTADLNNPVVLQVDEVESITVNGGQLGGLINIQDLTDKLNELVDKFNSHTHTVATGGIQVAGPTGSMSNANPISVPSVTSKAREFNISDYEDETIKH